MQTHCVSGTIHFVDKGSQKFISGAHRFETSRHSIFKSTLARLAIAILYEKVNKHIHIFTFSPPLHPFLYEPIKFI